MSVGWVGSVSSPPPGPQAHLSGNDIFDAAGDGVYGQRSFEVI